MQQADVVVVGAGLAGCATAFHLSNRARVLVLDAASQPGAEASADNAGMVRRLGEDPYERALATRTHAFLASDTWPEVSRATGALLGLTHDPGHLHDAVAHLRARGVTVQACTRPEGLAPATAGSPVPTWWHVPDERVADAHALVSRLVRGVREAGGAVRCGVAVHDVAVEAGRVVGVATAEGPIRADRVVLATGAWSRDLAARLGLDRPLVPIRRTLMHTAPHPISAPDHPWVWVDDVGIYARPEAGGWLCSGCDEEVDRPPHGPGSRGPVEPEQRALAIDKLERWLPALADARVVGGWSGLRTFAPDRRPVLGADPEVDGLWWAAGLGGFGVTCGWAVGEAVAAWMHGDDTPWLDRAAVSPGRVFPRRWPIRPDGDLGHARLVGV